MIQYLQKTIVPDLVFCVSLTVELLNSTIFFTECTVVPELPPFCEDLKINFPGVPVPDEFDVSNCKLFPAASVPVKLSDVVTDIIGAPLVTAFCILIVIYSA